MTRDNAGNRRTANPVLMEVLPESGNLGCGCATRPFKKAGTVHRNNVCGASFDSAARCDQRDRVVRVVAAGR